MTTYELCKLADEHALALEYTPMSTYHSKRKSYEAGFVKALQLVQQQAQEMEAQDNSDYTPAYNAGYEMALAVVIEPFEEFL